jgi:transposase
VSLRPEPIGYILEQTARIARAAFPAGNAYLRMRDELESLVEDRTVSLLTCSPGEVSQPSVRGACH